MAVDFFQLDQSIAIKGDDAAARTITIGQQVTNSDVFVIDTANCELSSAGALTLASICTASQFSASGNITGGTITSNGTIVSAGNITMNGGCNSPGGGTGSENEIYGLGAGGSLTSGNGNTMVGDEVGSNVTSGSSNTLMGKNAGDGISTANQCVAIGDNTLTAANVSGATAVGSGAMRYSEGDNNFACGQNALAGSSTTAHTGQFNVAVGADALLVIEGALAWNNIAIGGRSLNALTTGNANTCIGKDSGLLITTSTNNVLIGGSNGNTITTGSSNILIGNNVNPTSATTDQEFWLSYAGGGTTPLLSGNLDVGAGGMTAGVNIKPPDIDAQFHIVTESGDAQSTLKLEQQDTDDEFIDFEGTSAASAANSISSWTTGNSIQGFVRVNINGTLRWMPFYDAPTS